MAELLQVGQAGAIPAPLPMHDRDQLECRARLLAWGGNAWHGIEFAIAIGAGIAAGSIALIGFGADSLVEALAGSVIVWLFTGGRGSSHAAERRAQQLIAVSFFVLAAYVGVESVRDLIGGHHPGTSWVGIGLAAFTAPTMPLLARAKRQVGRQLNSSATVKEAAQNQPCAYFVRRAARRSAAERSRRLVVGRPPTAALVIAAVAVKEGRESWRGDGCCDAC